jgi:hypothetical protein
MRRAKRRAACRAGGAAAAPEGALDALAGEQLCSRQHVERDLQLLAAAEDAAVVPRRAPGLVVAQHEPALGAAVDAVDLARDAQHAFVAEVNFERLGVVWFILGWRPTHPEADLEVCRRRALRSAGLAREPRLHCLVEAPLLALPKQREARGIPLDETLERLFGHHPQALLRRLRVGNRQFPMCASLT